MWLPEVFQDHTPMHPDLVELIGIYFQVNMHRIKLTKFLIR